MTDRAGKPAEELGYSFDLSVALAPRFTSGESHLSGGPKSGNK
jgi:hypothetical protein